MSNTHGGQIDDEYSQFLVDQIAVMVKKEVDFYSRADYLGELIESKGDSIDECWRQKVAEWMFKVIDYYDLDRDIVNFGMAYLDQVFTLSAMHHCRDKGGCSLVAVASLKLAIKLFEPRTMNMDDMLKLGATLGCVFSPSAVVAMEHDILWTLSWNVFPPTAFCLAYHMIRMFPREVVGTSRYIMQELVKYMTELAVCVYSFVSFKVSSRSFASCLVAMDSLDDGCLISPKARAVFLERIHQSLGIRHDDKVIKVLTKELKDLICHNTDLNEFIRLIRASNKSEHESESPRTVSVKLNMI